MSTTELGPDVLPALQVSNLYVHFGAGRGRHRRVVRAVDGVSLRIAPGETLGLVGESGCGKSTLVRTVFGLHKPVSGRIQVAGTDVTALPPRARSAHSSSMQMVFQDPFSALDPRMTVHEIIAEPLRINRRYRAGDVDALMEKVGLHKEMARRRPAEFSGGQRQRVGIARALALHPDLLVLDEPVSALDVSVQAQVLNLLQDLQDEMGLAYLFISHDLSVVRHISDRVAVMYLGRIVETGSRDSVFGSPTHPYTRSLLSAAPVADPFGREDRTPVLLSGDLPDAANVPSGCAFRGRCPVAQDDCADIVPALQPRRDHAYACLFPDDAIAIKVA